jgi:hypothetical protein
MKVSELTLQTLKNFAAINPNFCAKGGSKISTVAEAKNIVANAVIDMELPSDFGIYDLNEFLSVLNLVEEPHIEFKDKYVVISGASGKSSITYYYSDQDLLTKSEKELIMPECEISFELDNVVLSQIKRASSALGHDNVRVSDQGAGIILTVMDKENSTGNTFTIEVPGSHTINEFEVYINIGNLKLLPGDYNVEVSSKFISRFTKKDTDHEYFVAVERTSTF